MHCYGDDDNNNIALSKIIACHDAEGYGHGAPVNDIFIPFSPGVDDEKI